MANSGGQPTETFNVFIRLVAKIVAEVAETYAAAPVLERLNRRLPSISASHLYYDTLLNDSCSRSPPKANLQGRE